MYMCIYIIYTISQFSLVTQSCPTLCDPMEYILYIHTIYVNKNTQIIYLYIDFLYVYMYVIDTYETISNIHTYAYMYVMYVHKRSSTWICMFCICI